jgi:selenocysteine-specific elongation factor
MTAQHDWVLGTAGHIDHGKTALVRALTGCDTDRLPQEKERGITIDLGFAPLRLGELALSIVDVPGHERFIRNMLAGATGIDLALLVVAADDSVMPQTREHLEILRLLGLAGGVVVLTKCDLADAAWLALVEDEVRALVTGTFLEGAPILRTSAATGQGIDELKSALVNLCATTPPRPDPGLFRMAIDRAFTVAGHGTVVTGTAASGSLAVGDELDWLPASRPVRVRGIQRHGRNIEQVGRGARVAINLAGVHHTELARGHELAAPGFAQATRIVSVEVEASTDAPGGLCHRGRYRVHLGTAEVSATLALLGGNELLPGQSGLGQLFLAEPAAAVYGEPLVLRRESPPTTLGGGRVLQPSPLRIRRRDRAAIERLARLKSFDPVERVAAALAFLGLRSAGETTLCGMTGLARADLDRVVAQLATEGTIVELPVGPRRTIRVAAEAAAELDDRVLRALGRLHTARPRQSAIPRAHVIAELPDLEGDALVGGILDRLVRAGKVVGDRRLVALRGYEPKLSQAERRLKDELARSIRDGGFSPPDAAELTRAAGPRAAVVGELLTLLCDEERIVPIGQGLYLDAEVESELRNRVGNRLADGSAITMADLRDLLGTSRKFAVPIGEYLDRVGVTQREGDLRRAGGSPEPQPAPAS